MRRLVINGDILRRCGGAVQPAWWRGPYTYPCSLSSQIYTGCGTAAASTDELIVAHTPWNKHLHLTSLTLMLPQCPGPSSKGSPHRLSCAAAAGAHAPASMESTIWQVMGSTILPSWPSLVGRAVTANARAYRVAGARSRPCNLLDGVPQGLDVALGGLQDVQLRQDLGPHAAVGRHGGQPQHGHLLPRRIQLLRHLGEAGAFDRDVLPQAGHLPRLHLHLAGGETSQRVQLHLLDVLEHGDEGDGAAELALEAFADEQLLGVLPVAVAVTITPLRRPLAVDGLGETHELLSAPLQQPRPHRLPAVDVRMCLRPCCFHLCHCIVQVHALHKGEISDNSEGGPVDARCAVHVHLLAHGQQQVQHPDCLWEHECLVAVVEVAHGDAGDDHCTLHGPGTDGFPINLQRLVTQLRLQAYDGVNAGLVHQSVQVRR
mmetsp:Transcript_5611/g.16037  ORF Transcript_5611/g.16037 Transcript_5611/m.16037 type:complete len:431 (+) Transcript_5611:292-1584(+)